MTSLILRIFAKDCGDFSSQKSRTKVGNIAGFTGIACNMILFAIKLFAGILSGSIAIIADAFNNLSDMGSSVVTLLGFKIAAKPADKEHPFGHGRMEYMSGFIVAIVIIVVGLELLKSSFDKIINPSDVTCNAVIVLILIISILIKLWMSIFYTKMGKTINSAALRTTAQDSINDVVSTSAVLITTLIMYFTSVNIDGYVGIAVAAFVIFGGFKSAQEMLSPLLGEPPDPKFVIDLKKRVMSYGQFVGLHDLVIHNYGPGKSFASLHVEVPANIDIMECHEIIDTCEREVGEEFGIELVLHMDPIDTDDKKVNELKKFVVSVINSIDPKLTLHDFRVVTGVHRTNLVFDVVLPYEVKMTDLELKDEIQRLVWKQNETLHCVINVDRNYL